MVAKRKTQKKPESVVDPDSINLFIAGADRSEVSNLVRTRREPADKSVLFRFTASELAVMDELTKLIGAKTRAEAIRCLIAEKYEQLKY